jgi:hypothetical protein
VEYALAVLLLLCIVALVVAYPLSRGAAAAEDERREALEAAKEAKYREIRDAELDYRMGKLSEEDYRATDTELRAQAIEILRELDRLDPESDRAAEERR